MDLLATSVCGQSSSLSHKTAKLAEDLGRITPFSATCWTTTYLINASEESGSSRAGASQESSQHTVRNGQPACESFVARQTTSQSSNVDNSATTAVYLVFCSFECFGAEQSVRCRRC